MQFSIQFILQPSLKVVEIFIVFVTALLAQEYSFLIASELSLLNGLGLLMIGCASLLGLQMLHLWDSKRPHFRISMYVTVQLGN